MRAIVEEVEATLPAGAWPIWTGSNHDVSRLATRWAGGDPAKVRCALLILLTLRGTPFLYQGDEIGLTDGPIEQADLRDAVGIRFWPYYKGRDAERTPMPWSDGAGGRVHPRRRRGPGSPWPTRRSATWPTKRADPDSVLAFTRRAMARRAGQRRSGRRLLPLPALARRHLGLRTRRAAPSCPQHVGCGPARSTESTGRYAWPPTGRRRGPSSGNALTLGPWSGVVVAR